MSALATANGTRTRVVLVLLGIVALLATSVIAVYAATRKPDYKLSVTDGRSITQGMVARYRVGISPKHGFDDAVRVSVSGLPRGARASFELPDGRSLPQARRNGPSVLPRGARRATLWVLADLDTPVGARDLRVTTKSGSLSHSKMVPFRVRPWEQPGFPQTPFVPGSPSVPPAQAEPAFQVIASPASRSILPGEHTTYDVALNKSNFSGPVDLSVSGLPAGATASFVGGSSVSGSIATLQVDLAPTTAPGTYDLTIAGTGGGTTGAGAAELVVMQGQDFTMSGAAPTPLSPGVTRPIDVRFSNPNSFAIEVTGITVALGDSSDETGCPAATNFEIASQYSGPAELTIPANAVDLPLSTLVADQSKWPQIRMHNLAVNQDDCKGVSVALDYSGAATR